MGSGRTSQAGNASAFAQPLLPVVLAFAVGAVLDRSRPVSWPVWMTLAGGAGGVWYGLRRRRPDWSAAALLMFGACTFAAWHHLWWNLYPAAEIGHTASAEPYPVCVRALVVTSPSSRLVPAPYEPAEDPQVESQLEVRLLQIRVWDSFPAEKREPPRRRADLASWKPVSGKCLLRVRGDLTTLDVGTEVEVHGHLSRPRQPLNPGEFDFAKHLRYQRVLTVLHADAPHAVHVLHRRSRPVAQALGRLRRAGRAHLQHYVGVERGELAAALLLGARHNFAPEQRTRFMVTGTIHLLAISGLHVGILVGAIWFIGRLGVPRRGTLWTAMLFVTAYALLTEARPPVVRAGTLVCLVCLARTLGRRTFARNTLAAAAIFLLMLNPTHLFQVGTQLSFLAVAVLGYWQRDSRSVVPDEPLQRLIYWSRPWPLRWARHVAFGSWELFRMTTLVWFFSAPLVARYFQLVTPVGLLLNPLVCLPISIALLSGFGVLLCGSWAPPLATGLGWVCNLSLGWIQQMIAWGEQLPGGHTWVPPLPLAWLIGFYGTLATQYLVASRRPAMRAFNRCLVGGWLISAIFLTTGAPNRAREIPTLDCTFVAVGHGTCVLIQTPGGHIWLYDAGSLGSPQQAARRISSVLWSQGVRRIDGVILSHADADHYNALAELHRRFAMQAVYVTPLMFRDAPELLRELRDALHAGGVPVIAVARGHQWNLDDGTTIRAFHPPVTGVRGSDNANSLVVEVAVPAGRLLLPGDLEGAGLQALVRRPRRHADVLMAPHHGSLTDDPLALIEWCQPKWVLISGGQQREHATDFFRTAGTQVRHTALHGATRVRLRPASIEVRSWLDEPW